MSPCIQRATYYNSLEASKGKSVENNRDDYSTGHAEQSEGWGMLLQRYKYRECVPRAT